LEPDLVVQNLHGVRGNLDSGAVHNREMYEVQPFDNYVVVFQIKVADLLGGLQNTFDAADGYGLPQ
jgi:2',3'-cyclic-nucleotide 2'-phosphodiesterase (5'-nucleotidase family)